MKKRKETDKLSLHATEALRRGMSYGQYMAKYHPVTSCAVHYKKCAECGAVFEGRGDYCSGSCRQKAEYRKAHPLSPSELRERCQATSYIYLDKIIDKKYIHALELHDLSGADCSLVLSETYAPKVIVNSLRNAAKGRSDAQKVSLVTDPEKRGVYILNRSSCTDPETAV